MKRILATTAALVSLAGAAHASIIPVLQGAGVAEGSDFRYTYQATLASDSGLMTGSKFVIFDFAGLVDGSMLADPEFVATSELTTAPFEMINFSGFDDPTLANLVFTWNGPNFNIPGGTTTFNFTVSALSTISVTTMGQFAARDFTNNGGAGGTVANNIGAVVVPEAADAGVPEPATWAMMILGFGGVGAIQRRRRTANAAF